MSEARPNTRLELIAYVALIVMAFVTVVTAIQQRIVRHSCSASSGHPLEGKPAAFGIPGVDWKANHYTLLFVLSTTCHFCEESADFYGTLVADKTVSAKVHMLAVFPQRPEEAEEFLSRHGLQDLPHKRAMLWQLGVNATPTLMVIDASGNVAGSWVGELDRKQQANLLARLRDYR